MSCDAECEKHGDLTIGPLGQARQHPLHQGSTHTDESVLWFWELSPFPNLTDVRVTTATRRKGRYRKKKSTLGAYQGWQDTLKQDSPNLYIRHSLLSPFRKWVPLQLKKQAEDSPSYCHVKNLVSAQPQRPQITAPIWELDGPKTVRSSGRPTWPWKVLSLQDSSELTHEERMTYFIPGLLLLISSVYS